MKNVLRFLIVAALVTAFATAAHAQDAAAAAPAQASPCTTDADAKAALYDKFLKSYKGTPDQQKAASETGKEYISKYGACTDESEKKIAAFIQNWVGKYDVAVRNFNCTDAFAKKDYTRTFDACRVVLNAEPDNIDIVLLLARAGYANVTSAAPNKSLNAEASRMARRAIEMIESGKAPTKWEPFPSRDEALGFLYYSQGVFTNDTSPTDSVGAFVKAAQSSSIFKQEPSTYIYIANLYEANELLKLVDAYKAAFPPGNPIPDEKKAQYDQMLAQIGRVQERIIDSLARAVSLMKADPKADQAKLKAQMTRLTNYYKARHEDKEDGLQELIANVMSKPLMLPGQEPAPTPPSSSSAVTGTDGTVKPTTPAVKATTTPVKSTTTPAQPAATNGTKPAATTTQANGVKPAPKPRSK
jgi:hypothetical protein